MRGWLKQLRKSKKLTQEQVATRSFIDRSYYSQIENGKRRPSLEVAKNIAKVLDFNSIHFFKEEIELPNNNSEEDEQLYQNDTLNNSIIGFLKGIEHTKLLYFYDKEQDYYVHILSFLYAAILKNNYCIVFDSNEYYLEYKELLDSLLTIEKTTKYIHFVDIKSIESLDKLFEEINRKILKFNQSSIYAWIHNENISQFALGKKLQELNPSPFGIVVQAYNAWTVSAGEHTKLMKEYPFLMTDGQIFQSPFYNRTSKSTSIFPSLYFQD